MSIRFYRVYFVLRKNFVKKYFREAVVMTFTQLSHFSFLQKQHHNSWQQFSESHPQIANAFITQASAKVVNDFKTAITLSDFILQSALQCPQLITELFHNTDKSNQLNSVYQLTLPNYHAMLTQLLSACKTEAELHTVLRQFRRQQMVKIATADLVLNAPLSTSLLQLSTLADALIDTTLTWLSELCYQRWGKPTNSQGETLPLLVYGMGKLGGKELNFSSDIDLIFAYPEAGQTVGARRSIDNQQFFTRLAQKLITALHQVTVDGFVYRVDMRLRPFGDSGPLVMTFSAMEDYYQEQGRDWERYAMLKARLIGNSPYHDKLTQMLRPFVYRRYIDFSVIDSLRRMKMMIAQEVRRKQLINNIKLGAGGIREIEFIVQVFQLIRGGQIKALQQRNLLTVLPRLVEYNIIDQRSCDILKQAYCFLRRVENIIQAIADQQTQTLPDNELDQQRLIAVLGFTNWQDFLAQLTQHMCAVHQEFLLLIGKDSPNHQARDQQWQLFWQTISQQQDAQKNQQENLLWLTKLAPKWQAEKTYQVLYHFKQEAIKRGIGQRGNQILDKLIPLLLWHLVQTANNEVTLERLLVLLQKIATRTAYLELLYENEGALKHLIKLCHESAWLSEYIARYPILLDELIDPTLLHNPPALTDYACELRQLMLRIPEDDLEAQMDTLRQFKQAQQLRIAAGDISGVLPLVKVSDHLTALAEAIIAEVINLAWQQVTQRFGIPESLVGKEHKGFAAIGYGKLGGYELAYSSDLDLVFIHDSVANELTTGKKQLLASQFYAKLAQRIMHIFNTRMSSGILYELDMRLRPSGNAGVLVVNMDTFAQYQQQQAWTWEHQALVRARLVYGHKPLQQKFSATRQHILSLRRDIPRLQHDVIAMRQKMRAHLDTSNDDGFDIKQGQGGLIDIEFLVQFLVLSYGHRHPQIVEFSDNLRILMALEQVGVISHDEQLLLSKAYCQLRDFGHRRALQKQRLTISDELKILTQKVAQLYQGYLAES